MDPAYDSRGVNSSIKALRSVELISEDAFRVGALTNADIDPNLLEANNISYHKADLEDALAYPSASFDCVDATLSIHHATRYTGDLDRITSEIYRVLKLGGLFPFGTGSVDMKYTERKIYKILSDLNLTGAIIIDERGKTVKRRFGTSSAVNFRITHTGQVVITNLEEPPLYLRMLQEMGYSDVSIKDNSIVLPLIDPGMPDDLSHHIVLVNEYYNAIRSTAEDGFTAGLMDKDLLAAIITGINFECNNAIQGLVEHYTSESRIIESLRKARFSEI